MHLNEKNMLPEKNIFTGQTDRKKSFIPIKEIFPNEYCSEKVSWNKNFIGLQEKFGELKDNINLNDVLQSLNIGIVVIDLNGRVKTLNREAENILNIKYEKAVSMELSKILSRKLYLNSLVDILSLKNFENEMHFETEVDIEGNSLKYINLNLSPVRCCSGYLRGAMITLHDVTRIRKLEERESRNNRLIAMGEMAANIAHEVRNPLGSIELFANILENELKNNDKKREIAKHISKGVKSINSIISNLLLFINPQLTSDFKEFNIHDILDDSLFFSKHLIDENEDILLKTKYACDALFVKGDQELMKQVILNIILNAFQAMPNRGSLHISTSRIIGSSRKSFVQIIFADTGIGINSNEFKRIFDPFFTTKRRGTGLGLTIVHSIVRMHEGNIEIRSIKGKGTECILTFPEYKIISGEYYNAE